MRYSENRKIIMTIAWLIGAGIGGLGVFFFSMDSVDQPQITEKKKTQTERRVRRTRSPVGRTNTATVAPAVPAVTPGVATATFALG